MCVFLNKIVKLPAIVIAEGDEDFWDFRVKELLFSLLKLKNPKESFMDRNNDTAMPVMLV